MALSRREILERVARGELSPEEADELLRAGAADETTTASPHPSPSRIARVKIRAGFGAIVVEGDESVVEADVDGLHQASHDDDTLVIHSDVDPEAAGRFEFEVPHRRHRRRRVGIAVGPMVFGSHGGRPRHRSSLRIRINPNLALDVRLDAGSLSLSHLRAPVRARMSAGPITIEDFTAPLDVSVNAGAIRALGELTWGESRIKSDAGAVRVELKPSSNVRILADTALGKIVLPGHDEGSGKRFSSRREAVIGSGEATLRVETAMGSIHVTTADSRSDGWRADDDDGA